MKPPHHGPPRRPSIAITPDFSKAQPPEISFPKIDVRQAYAEAVLRAGGLPFVLPVTDDRQIIDAFLERVSGVVITGGAFDIAPELYGQTAREGMGPTKPERTNFELALLKSALSKHIPVLGICGGMQLINVAFGGTLIQDLSREMPAAKSHEQKHDRTQPQHPVEVKEGTLAADAFGKGPLMVNSTHHQAVHTVGAGLVVSATAPDGVIEAIESRANGFVMGVQWHPELLVDTIPHHLGAFRSLVTKARERRH